MLIQIVDDSRAMREAIRAVLGGLDAEFVESSSGEDGVRDHAARRPDVVIMDVRMGGMDGLEATRAIRAFSPAARIVVLTQFDDDAIRQAARDAGAAAYVVKTDLSALLHVVTTPPTEEHP